MDHYYVNTQAQPVTKDHEVHVEGCTFMPSVTNRKYLGYFSNCHDAVRKAKNEGYSTADGCKHCCPACHTS